MHLRWNLDNVRAVLIPERIEKDEIVDKQEVEINSLSKPMLIQYYAEAVRNWE